jgi:hypothetical protein
VTARFVPLGHEDISTSSRSYASILSCLYLTYRDSPPFLGATQPGLGISKGKEDSRDVFFQNNLEVLRQQGKEMGDEPNAKGPVGLGTDSPDLFSDIVRPDRVRGNAGGPEGPKTAS